MVAPVMVKRIVLLNQMAGPLSRETAEGLAPYMEDGCLLLTGHPDTVSLADHTVPGLVIRKAPGYSRRTLLHRFLSWVSYLLVSSWTILGARKSDAFLIVSNPPMMGAWFCLLNMFRRQPYAVLVYDIHPDVLVSMGMLRESGLIVSLWRMINNIVYENALIVITLGERLATRLSENMPVNCDKPAVIPPWADTDKIRPLISSENLLVDRFNPENRKVILYSGNMGISHDIDSIFEAAKLLKNREDVLFVFIGSGEKWQDARDFGEHHGLDNIQVHPFQPEENLPYTMALASISLVALDKGAEGLMVPSKLFYYLAAGSAVIGICEDDNELRDIIEGAGCGYCVRSGNPAALAKTIEGLLDDEDALTRARRAARNLAEQTYSRTAGVQKFVTELQKAGLIPPQVEAEC